MSDRLFGQRLSADTISSLAGWQELDLGLIPFQKARNILLLLGSSPWPDDVLSTPVSRNKLLRTSTKSPNYPLKSKETVINVDQQERPAYRAVSSVINFVLWADSPRHEN